MNQNPIFVLAVLFSIIFLVELLAGKTWLKHLGTAMIVIIIGAIFGNLGIIFTASNSIPLCDIIFTYLVPIALFILLLEVDLRGLKKAGLPMIGMFLVGAIGTTIVALVAIQLIGNVEIFGEARAAIARMFIGTYIGGSINFNAVALHYGILENAELYAGAVAIDNIVTTIWMLACIGIPVLLNRLYPQIAVENPRDLETVSYMHEERAELSTTSIALLIAMALFALVGSKALGHLEQPTHGLDA